MEEALSGFDADGSVNGLNELSFKLCVVITTFSVCLTKQLNFFYIFRVVKIYVHIVDVRMRIR